MGLVCNCPRGAEIIDVPIDACPQSFGQIQKVIFQRMFSAAGVKNTIASGSGIAGIEVLASWTPLLAAADGTKVVQSPYLTAPTSEPGAPRTYGGGNETLGGIEIIIGREPTTFTANILRQHQKTIKALKDYQCEEIGVYLVDEYGRIGADSDDATTPTTFYPIPVAGLFIGDKAFGGLESPDMNGIQWSFLPNWSDNFNIATPSDFNALTALVTP